MPLRPETLAFIRRVAGEFDISRVLLFGSCLELDETQAGDIDIAVEGLSRKDVFAFRRRLNWADEMHRRVDVVRMEDDDWIVPIVEDEGVVIYEAEHSAVAR